ncbi:cue domain-containing protein [Mucor ambiguus]|uniref:Cue domain-containing protein n=1 Tax=Mucor ambiguus TaxID=91626 RepID=A0A0C9M3Z4_9FUNG|nr:cue domain-containing protein [Mucor ambiguus]
MLEFIPYIASTTKDIDESTWNIAFDAWVRNLAELLNLQDAAFLHETTSNKSLSLFVEQILNAQMDAAATVDPKLVRHVFFIYYRLAAVQIADSNPLLTADKLCSFAVVYGESNASEVRRIMAQLAQEEAIEKELLSVIGTLVDAVQSMPDLLAAPASIETLDRAYVLVRVLDALFSATLFVDVIQSSFDALDSVLIECYRDIIPTLKKTVDSDSNAAPYAFLVKRSLVSTFNSYADGHLFRPLGYISSTKDHQSLDKLPEPVDATVIDLINHKLLEYIENSGLESSKNAFVDGPLILDWEVEYRITEKLDKINKDAFGGDEERLEFLKLSMEQVRDSNMGTGSWGDNLQPQQAPAEAQQNPAIYQNVERTSKISQIHDLFPGFGDGFIEACLDANNDDVEVVIMQLLEDALPASVSGLDRKMERKPLPDAAATVSRLTHLESEAEAVYLEAEARENPDEESVLKSRRNVYDNDEFDIFNRRTVDTSKVYAGKKDKGDADALLDDKSFIQSEKKNVLQRVVDMYDDDYDDTYDDINDAGVPSTMENGDGDAAVDVVRKKQEVIDPGIENESLLVHSFVDNAELFARNSTARKSTKRAELRKRTGMTDEQLEGWAIMFKRNPRKDRILDRYMLFDGNQAQVSEDVSQAQKQSLKKENKRPPRSESKERAYKDKNKARFGNHNRKAQRDKKVAKAGPPPS